MRPRFPGNALFEERGMINALGVRRDKHSENNLRKFLDHRAAHGGTVRPRFTMRGTSGVAEERQTETEKERERKKARVGSIASFVDNRTVTERQVLE